MSTIPNYCNELLDSVEMETSYHLIVTPERLRGFANHLTFGNYRRPVHELRYHPDAKEHAAHFIVQAAYRILRLWDCAPKQRYLGAVRRRKLPKADETYLSEAMAPISTMYRMQLSRTLAAGMTHLLLSTPSDIRIEREVYEELPRHRESQALYLRGLVNSASETLNPDVLSKVPPTVRANTSAMNAVAIAQYASLIGVAPHAIVEEQSPRKLVDKLTALLNTNTTPGAIGDRQVTDAWASELGLTGWFEWVLQDYH